MLLGVIIIATQEARMQKISEVVKDAIDVGLFRDIAQSMTTVAVERFQSRPPSHQKLQDRQS